MFKSANPADYFGIKLKIVVHTKMLSDMADILIIRLKYLVCHLHMFLRNGGSKLATLSEFVMVMGM